MRVQKYAIAIGLVFLAMAVTVPLSMGQAKNLIAKVPFDFYMGDKLMPSGNYTITPWRVNHAIQIHNDKYSAFSLANPNDVHFGEGNLGGNLLVFNRYGNRYFLAELYWEGLANGWQIVQATREGEARKTSPATRVAITLTK